MSARRGRCPTCGTERVLRKDGTVPQHFKPNNMYLDGNKARRKHVCAGTGMRPRYGR